MTYDSILKKLVMHLLFQGYFKDISINIHADTYAHAEFGILTTILVGPLQFSILKHACM